MSQERVYWLAWSQVAGVGPILLDRLDRHFNSLEAAWNADAQSLLSIDGLGFQSIAKIVAARAKIDLHQLIAQHAIANPHWWARSDPDYPRLLREIPSAPGILYYRGQVDLDDNRYDVPTVGVVGTRHPSDYGKRWARKISSLLAAKGCTIVSGMAEGIDTEAHSACLEVGGKTIAVVGTGVNIVYPPRNQALAVDIHQHGLIVSEYPAGTQPNRPHFPARNRIIAGLSRVVIVIEAPTKSGALITAHQANDFGRDVYVLPGSIDNPNSIGCLGLLSRGAQPILSLEHLLELLASVPKLDTPEQLQLFTPQQPSVKKEMGVLTHSQSESSLPLNLDSDSQQVWLVMTNESCNFDSIVDRTQLPTATVSIALLQLELRNLITQLPGMRYQKSDVHSLAR
jgi:DNA processing protein